MMRARSGEVVVTLAASTALAGVVALVVWPVARVLEASLIGPTGPTVAGYVALFTTPAAVDVVLVSLGVAAAVTGLVMIIASPLAYGLARGAPAGSVVRRLLLIPLVTPPFTAGLGVVLLLGRQGLLTRALGLGWSIEGVQGIVAGQAIAFLPPAVLALAAVFGRVHADLEEAAEILGAGPLLVLRRVTLSLARPGIMAIALVVFFLALADLGTPMIAGGEARVMTTAIYASVVAAHDVAGASVLATLLLVLSLISYGVALAMAGWTVHGAPAPALPDEAGRSRPATRMTLLAVTFVVPAVFVVVDGAVAVGSVVRGWGTDWSWSAHHFVAMSTTALTNSVGLGLAAALIATLAAIAIALVARHVPGPGRRFVEAVGTLPAGFPGPVLGVGYLLIAGDPSTAAAVTPVVIVASIVAGKFPLVALRVTRRLDAIEPATEEVAVSLGAGRVQIFTRIVAPRLSGTVVGGFVEVFTAAILTIGAVAFLTGARVPLASVDGLDRARAGALGTACAVAVTLSLLAGAVAVVRRRIGGDEPLILFSG
jgi:iron(III) transport system permease protein